MQIHLFSILYNLPPISKIYKAIKLVKPETVPGLKKYTFLKQEISETDI